MRIESMADLERAVQHYGILPFFGNNIKGFSVEEMTTPALLFGGNEYEGCWEWKGPVVRRRTTAYGKFFRKKAGFVSLELLPHFLNVRRAAYKVTPGTIDEMLLDIIEISDRLTSTELRKTILGTGRRKRTAADLPNFNEASEAGDMFSFNGGKRHSRHVLEAPLQRLQMAGRVCIADFEYKKTRKGERYGWGVAAYTTPESLFGPAALATDASPEESLEVIVEKVCGAFRKATPEQVRKLLG